MSKLIAELANEIHASNPNYSTREISNRITEVIEDEVLPSVIEQVPLPSIPSPINIRIQKLRRQRIRGKRDTSGLQEKIDFIRDLERMRKSYYLSDSTFSELNIAETKDFIQKHIVSPVGSLEKEKEYFLSETYKSFPQLEPSSFLSVSEKKEQEQFDPVIFSPEVMKKIASDPNYEKMIANVELRIRERYRTISSQITFIFSQRRDMEDPKREKTVINMKILNMNFKEKMNNWLRFDFEVRKAIKSLDLAEDERKKMNRNIVTHVESD